MSIIDISDQFMTGRLTIKDASSRILCEINRDADLDELSNISQDLLAEIKSTVAEFNSALRSTGKRPSSEQVEKVRNWMATNC